MLRFNIGDDGFIWKISGVPFIFNKLDTPCHRRLEFVNHLMAACKSGNVWIRIAQGTDLPSGGRQRG
jgi:hypothetical protein